MAAGTYWRGTWFRPKPSAGRWRRIKELVVVVGPPIGIDAANELAERSTGGSTRGRRTEVVAYDAIEQLPEDARGLDAADWVILSSGAPGRRDSDMAAAQALRRWVESGGRLVAGAGRDAKTNLAAGSPLAWTAPGGTGGVVHLRQLGALEAYIESTDTAGQAIEAGLDVATLSGVNGVVEASDGGRADSAPLVVRRAFGFGRIVFVTFALDSPALARWSGRPKLINRLLERRPQAADVVQPRTGRSATSAKAYVDLGEQFRDALGQFSDVSRASVGTVLSALVGFLILVGPVDYYLVRRRPQWTWLTFAVSATLFVAGAGWLSGRLRPDGLRVNRVEVVDIDVGGESGGAGLVRGSAWLEVCSPRADAMKVAYAGGTAGINPAARGEAARGEAAHEIRMTAPPTGGRGFQGAAGLVFTQAYIEPYRVERDGTLGGVSIAAGGTRAAFVEWNGDVNRLPVTSLTLDQLGRPRGEFVQPLAVDLDDCVLYAGTSAYRLGRLAGGAAVKIDESLEPQSAVALLTRRRMIEDRQTAAPYDQASLDVARVLEMILFHELAGGEGYTRLRNDIFGRLDLSGHLALDRAILVGTSRQPAGEVSITTDAGAGQATDANDVSLTVYRFVIPLKRGN